MISLKVGFLLAFATVSSSVENEDHHSTCAATGSCSTGDVMLQVKTGTEPKAIINSSDPTASIDPDKLARDPDKLARIVIDLRKNEDTKQAVENRTKFIQTEELRLTAYTCLPLAALVLCACPWLYRYHSDETDRMSIRWAWANYLGFLLADVIVSFLPGMLSYLQEPEGTCKKLLENDRTKDANATYEECLGGFKFTVYFLISSAVFSVCCQAALGWYYGTLKTDTDQSKVTPTDVFMNFEKPIGDVIFRFFGQTILMWIFCASLIIKLKKEKGESNDPTEHFSALVKSWMSIEGEKTVNEPIVLWNGLVLFILPLLQGIVRSSLGNEFFGDIHLWKKIMASGSYKLTGSGGSGTASRGISSRAPLPVDKAETGVKVSLVSVKMRGFMACVVNQVYFGVLAYTIPFQFYNSNPADLVMNLLGVTFIAGLDDEPNAPEHEWIEQENDERDEVRS